MKKAKKAKKAQKVYKLIGTQQPGLMSKMNAPSYRVPKTPRQSGFGWGG